MSDSKYNDPDSRDSILTVLEKEHDHNEVQKLIRNVFPDWLSSFTDGYSKDYPHLTKNWHTICKRIGVTPKKIVLVRNIPIQDKDKILIQAICEKMTRSGYVVRRTVEFTYCSVCKQAIPTEGIYNKMRETFDKLQTVNRGLVLPDVWSNKCVNC